LIRDLAKKAYNEAIGENYSATLNISQSKGQSEEEREKGAGAGTDSRHGRRELWTPGMFPYCCQLVVNDFQLPVSFATQRMYYVDHSSDLRGHYQEQIKPLCYLVITKNHS